MPLSQPYDTDDLYPLVARGSSGSPVQTSERLSDQADAGAGHTSISDEELSTSDEFGEFDDMVDGSIDEIYAVFDEPEDISEDYYIRGARMHEKMFYPCIALKDFGFSNYSKFHEFATHRKTQAAFRELQGDYLTPSPSSNNLPCKTPTYAPVAARVKLCKAEPGTWCYDKPNPDKTNWSGEAHYARFSIQLQVVRRQINSIPPGPLRPEWRDWFVTFDINFATFMKKMYAVHESYVPQSADILADN